MVGDEKSEILRRTHSKRGHKLKSDRFCSSVPILRHGPGTFEVCLCGWEGWLSINPPVDTNAWHRGLFHVDWSRRDCAFCHSRDHVMKKKNLNKVITALSLLILVLFIIGLLVILEMVV